MELGVGMFGDLTVDSNGKKQNPQTRLKELIEEIKLMDQVGLDFFGIGEHHRAEYAVAVPEIILAAAAAVTKNIKLGSAVSVLSSSDPVRLYQSFSTVDLLSDNRAELVVGRGSFIESFPLYGYDLRDYDALFEEKLNLLLQINDQKTVTWKGRFRSPLQEQQIFPRTQREKLDIWVAVGGTPESVERTARLGLPIIFAIIGGSPVQFKPLFNYYKELYQQHGHEVSKMQIGVHMHSLFGENSEDTANAYYPYYAAQMDRIGKERGWPKYQQQQFQSGRARGGHLLIGDANESIEKIIELKEMFGLTRFSAHMDVGGPSHETLMKSIEIFGEQIAPAVRKAVRR